MEAMGMGCEVFNSLKLIVKTSSSAENKTMSKPIISIRKNPTQ